MITGAGSGIGRATALRLADPERTVVAVDVDGDAAEATASMHDEPIVHIPCDVSDPGAVERVVAVASEIGDLSELVNVAGIGSTSPAPATSVDEWDAVMDVNVRGTFLTCKFAIPQMVEAGQGAIVNVASVAGLVGLPNRAAYCASKGAVIALTRALAVDHVADGVRVNCVCPGTVDSPWVRRLVEQSGESLEALRARQPLGRLGTPEEIAEAIAYLLDPRAAFVTGSALVIDGGLTAA